MCSFFIHDPFYHFRVSRCKCVVKGPNTWRRPATILFTGAYQLDFGSRGALSASPALGLQLLFGEQQQVVDRLRRHYHGRRHGRRTLWQVCQQTATTSAAMRVTQSPALPSHHQPACTPNRKTSRMRLVSPSSPAYCSTSSAERGPIRNKYGRFETRLTYSKVSGDDYANMEPGTWDNFWPESRLFHVDQ